jgi:hypothetical protein
MRTMQFQQPDGAAQVTKHHQFLAEDLNPMGHVLQFVGKADRLPKAAHVLAARCARADMGQLGIFPGNVTVVIPSVS